MPIAPPNYSTLTAMITPAFFMTATGSLIISTSNRMSRIVDRIRQLNEQADSLSRGKLDLDFPAERLEHLAVQLDTPGQAERSHSPGLDAALPGVGPVRGNEPHDGDSCPDRQRRHGVTHGTGDRGSNSAASGQRAVDSRGACGAWGATGWRLISTRSSADGGRTVRLIAAGK